MSALHGLMSATLRKLDDEPILIVTHQGHLDLQAAEEASAQVARVLEASDVPLYGIVDLRAATSGMGDVMRILVHQTQVARGPLGDAYGRMVLVGGHPMIRIFRKLFLREPFAGLLIPVYTTMEDALAAQRARIREDAQR